ncbi:MAG: hypothetical protein ABF649_08795 [Bacillus sp. (in: firmicutes)]
MKSKRNQAQENQYDERLLTIDGELCALLQKRKEICGKQSGMPPARFIQIWAEQYDSHERFLNTFFGLIKRQDQMKLPVEPKGFIKHIPVLKAAEKKERIYSITHILQYKNVSIMYFT